MKARLLNNLIQDVPEEYSVCEFECRETTCTVKNHMECELFQQASKGAHSFRQHNPRISGQQPDTKLQPVWLYEVMPIIYILAGFTVLFRYDSYIGYVIGGLLLILAIIIWAMRIKHRAMNILSTNNQTPHRPDRS